VTDAGRRMPCHHPGVVITIRLDATDPPAGRISLAGGPEVDFVGWLGLLRVLSDLLAPTKG
jgi:hypothetical protein